jgi:hypothetical protein
MGQSTDAIICYGVAISEDFDFPEFDYDAEDSDAEAVRNPLGYMVDSGDPVGDIVLVQHCSDAYPMYIVAIKGTEIRAWRGSPRLFFPQNMVSAPHWDAKLRAFCEKHNIPFSEPGWILCSNWS